MGLLTNKTVLVGVTGGIAAYKAPDVVRRLAERGAAVRVMMSEAAGRFITPLTLQAVSGYPVAQALLEGDSERGLEHIDLARWADVILIAPATADFLARLAAGRADDLLAATCLARNGLLAVAPAMNRQMWESPTTGRNVASLRAAGVHIFGPGQGDQACGEIGAGRMRKPIALAEDTAGLFDTGALAGRRVLITAGPTWEAIDPVRGLTNRSSGKMGYAIAEAAREAGGSVTLVSGPTALSAPQRVAFVSITSAAQMHDAVTTRLAKNDIFIGVAAVSDYTPARTAEHKLKKDGTPRTLELVPTVDILAAVAGHRPRVYVVGFAAETEHLLKNARAKLESKNVDLIVANDVNDVSGQGRGFGSDINAITLVDAAGDTPLAPATKTRLARQLIDEIARRCDAKDSVKNPRRAHRR